MSSAGFALQKAIFEKLSGDASTLAALGGPRIYDDAPARTEFPFVTFGQSTERDWSTGSDEGYEHLVTLHVWSRARGRRETEIVIAAARAALHDQDLTLAGHRLINLRHEFSEARRDSDGETFHGIARFRAVTEVEAA
ncbi:MAG: DUF3168 domain-containing protein [Hyphomicrobium sp.]|uniref:DUF3168 domain-containing protein n=1 Tax=Hyphomicrobium sp. TaxID=82 RepID=UPI0035633AD0